MTEKRKPKLHELLAVEQDKKGSAERARCRTVETFRSKKNHFVGLRRTFKPFAVDEDKGEVAGERVEADTRLVNTVPEELERLFASIGEAVDIGYQIDEANTEARADLVFQGEVIAEQLPATFLLQLEKRLREIRSVLKEVPTFDPIRMWSADPGAGKKHVLRAEPVSTIRKQRTRKYNVMYDATEHHPAQIDVVEIDEPVGEIRTYDWTGMISPGQYAVLIEQADALIEAVKRARSRANTVEIQTKEKIAQKVFGVLLKSLQSA